jgi:hypothetical protein
VADDLLCSFLILKGQRAQWAKFASIASLGPSLIRAGKGEEHDTRRG